MTRKQFFLTLSVAIISGVLGGALSIWLLIPQSVLAQEGVPEVIEAQEFRVVNEEGERRVTLNKEQFSFWDEDGVAFNLSSIPGKVELYMSRGESSVDIFVNDSRVNIGVEDQTGRLDMTSTAINSQDWEKGDSFALDGRILMLFNGESYEEIILGFDADKKPSLELYDSTGALRAVLGSTELKNARTGSTEIRAPSSLVLFNEEGNVVWSAP